MAETVSTTSITIPPALAAALGLRKGARKEMPRWMLEGLVAEAVRSGRVSRGAGASMLGISWHQAEQFYADRGICYDYTFEELKSELAAFDRIRK